MSYPNELKEAVLRKALVRELPQRALAEQFGISATTIQNWLRAYRNAGVVEMGDRARRPQDWITEERLEALIETGAMSAEEVGAWCRGHGLHTHHLEQWRRELTAGDSKGRESSSALRALREENRSLKKALRRKDQALAETAALLVLKKKRT